MDGHPASDGPASESRECGIVPGIDRTAPAQDTEPGPASLGRTAFNWPLGVAPVPEDAKQRPKWINGAMLYYAGGVAIRGRSEHPPGHAGLGDKLIGKAACVEYSLG